MPNLVQGIARARPCVDRRELFLLVPLATKNLYTNMHQISLVGLLRRQQFTETSFKNRSLWYSRFTAYVIKEFLQNGRKVSKSPPNRAINAAFP